MITPFDIFSVETWILLITVIVLIRYYIHRKWQVLKKLHISHDPPSIRGLGNSKDLFKNPSAMLETDLLQKKKFGSAYGSYMFLSPRITIGDPEILKHIFIKEFDNFSDRRKNFNKIQGKILSTALTLVGGTQWKRIRNTLGSTFSTSKLKEMIGIIDQCADVMIGNLEKGMEENGGRFDPKETFGKLAMEVVCSAAFSVNVHSQICLAQQDVQEGKETKEIEMAKRLFDPPSIVKKLGIMLIMICPPIENILYKLGFTTLSTDVTNHFIRLTDAIIKKRSNPEFKTVMSPFRSKFSSKKVQIGLMRHEIIANSLVMIMSGYATTTGALLYFSYNLATHKEVQKKIQKEVDDAISEHGSLTYEAVNSMKYLNMSLNESLRFHNIFIRNARHCERKITIKGIKIPAGVNIDIPVWALSHDEEYWDEPYKYKPERMEEMNKINPMVYLPFGAGPRNCIGMRLAIMEIKVTICKIIEKFDLVPCEDTPKPPLELKAGNGLEPKTKIFLKVVPRKLEE